MTRVTKCLGIMVASIVGTGVAYDAHRLGLASAFGALAVMFFIGLLPAADADMKDWYRR